LAELEQIDLMQLAQAGELPVPSRGSHWVFLCMGGILHLGLSHTKDLFV